jgi:hypothetical protein
LVFDAAPSSLAFAEATGSIGGLGVVFGPAGVALGLITGIGYIGYQLFKSDGKGNGQAHFYIEHAGPGSPGGYDPKEPKNSEEEKKGSVNNNNRIRISEKSAQHIFRNKENHFSSDTPENRTVLERIANSEENLLGTSKRGAQWYGKTIENGKRIWVEVRNGEIRNGGINDVPREFNSETGLSRQVSPQKG